MSSIRPVIEELEVAQFKAISEPVRLSLAPLTLLVGANGAGKSSMLEGLALLAQSVRPGAKYGLQPTGRLVSLEEDLTALYHARRTNSALRVGVTFRMLADKPAIRFWFSVREAQNTGWEARWEQGLQWGDPLVEFFREERGDVKARLQGGEEFRVSGQPSILLDRQLFHSSENVAGSEVLRGLEPAADALAAFLTSPLLRYVTALRGAPVMTRKAEGSATSSGRFGEDTVRLLSLIAAYGKRSQRVWLDALAARFGMPDLAASYGGDGLLVAQFEEPYSRVRLDIDSAGFGSQQSLPVIADLVHAEEGSVVLVEEIEHSCHPRWVREWGLTLAEAAARGIQIVATTHAPDLVLAVGLAVRKGVVPPDAVVVHEFERDGAGVRVGSQRPDRTGRMEREWLRTFASAEAELLGELLREDAESAPEPAGSPVPG